MATLSEQLAQLANTAPVFQDPEQDTLDVTLAKLAEKGQDDGLEITSQSKLRTKSSGLLEEADSKYSGKRISRKKLKDEEFSDDEIDQLALKALNKAFDSDDQSMDDDEDDDDEDEDEQESEMDDEEQEDKKAIQNYKKRLQQAKKEFSFEDDSNYSKYADDDEDEDEDESIDGEDEDSDLDDEDGDDDDDDEGYDDEYNDEKAPAKKSSLTKESEGIKHFSKSAGSEEVEKGKAARNQLGIWDNLLECRIKLQKTLCSINQLPQPSSWNLFTELGGEKFENLATEAQSELKTLLEKLVQLQTVLLLQNPATKYITSDKKPTNESSDEEEENRRLNSGVRPEDDEEITSEEDEVEEEDTQKLKKTLSDAPSVKRKIPLEDYPDFLAKRHTEFHTFRNDTINKWNSKTQLVSGRIKSKGFSAFNQSALKQIEQIMSDRDRLIKRTQLKRSDYRVLGTTQEERAASSELPPDVVDSIKPVIKPENEYDEEIFDDSDFYHHMLREFIERKSTEIDDPLALSRQWLEVQKSRTKVKKQVDTKASKGRKLRYHVRQKLVNFMAPMNFSPWTEEARDDLFKSLFGQKVSAPDVSDESNKGR